MKAALLKDKEGLLSVESIDPTLPIDDERVVVIYAGALNHRDVWITQGKYPGIRFPTVLGSDGSGICDGKEVVIQPGFSWGDSQSFQADGYHILGLPKSGTFAQLVNIPAQNIFPKPGHLSFYESAALPLAGLTAYRSLFQKGEIMAGKKVLVSGIGGGVALFALQFALAAGAEVYVSSSSTEKIKKAIALGAKEGVLYTEEKWSKSLTQISGGIDLVIDGAGGGSFNEILKACNPGAIISIYGGTAGTIQCSPQLLFWKQIQVRGTTMGSPMDFQNMLNFVNEHQIVPIIDSVHKLKDVNQAFQRMNQGVQFGKIIVNLSGR